MPSDNDILKLQARIGQLEETLTRLNTTLQLIVLGKIEQLVCNSITLVDPAGTKLAELGQRDGVTQFVIFKPQSQETPRMKLSCDSISTVQLYDGEGFARLALHVDESGEPSIVMLDEDMNVCFEAVVPSEADVVPQIKIRMRTSLGELGTVWETPNQKRD